jgi:hypothetical protein
VGDHALRALGQEQGLPSRRGPALDWHLDAAKPADRREAARLIDLLLAADEAGNPHALARRMGIQEIIWNCRSCLSWAGARKKTSFWR